MKNNYYVVKRSGEEVPFEIAKIRNVIDWAIGDFKNPPHNLNSLSLESKVEIEFKAKMRSKDITASIIEAANNLVSLDEPAWRIVSARLKISSMYKEASETRDYVKFGYDNYHRFLKQAKKLGLYSDEILKSYSSEELKRAGKEIEPKYDLDFDFAGANSLDIRYLIKHQNKIFELPQEMFMSIALLIEKNQDKDVRMERVFDTYHKLGKRKVSLATPILINLRRPNGNLSSCFILAVDDSLESIQYGEEQAGLISQSGGGVGYSVSALRSKNAPIQNHPNASGGIIPWIKAIDTKATNVNQLGKRKGAFTVAVDVWHRDIIDFLEIQTENGDARKKAYDIQPQVVLLDEFLKRVENNDYWYMVDPYEVKKKYKASIVDLYGDNFSILYNQILSDIESEFNKYNIKGFEKSEGQMFESKIRELKAKEYNPNCLTLVSKIKAKELLKHIMKVMVETGRPYLAFKDTINRFNPNKDSGVIRCGNLCMESFSNTSPSKIETHTLEDGQIVRRVTPGDVHTCNLVSVVLSNLETNSDEEIEDVTFTSVRILDNLIDLTTTPIIESNLHNLKYRTIGVGFMGYADLVAKNKIMFENSEEYADEIFEKYAYYCTKASMLLAKERGSFESFDKSEYPKGNLLGKNKTWFKKNSKMHKMWCDLIDDIKQFGIRNSQITAIAPNSSTSLLMGCTPSVLAIFGKYYMDNAKATVPVMPPFIKECFWLYKENKFIDQRKVINVMANIQKWIDTGISMELILNPNLDFVNAKYLYELIMMSWKKELKTIYYIRSIQADGALSDKEECASCAG